MTVKKMKIGPGVLKLNAARTVPIGTTSASSTITAATATFSSSDVGATITGTGIPAGATIVSVETGTSATLSAAATATGSPEVVITPTGGEADFSCQITTATVEWSDEEEDTLAVLCGDEEPGEITWSASLAGSMVTDPELAEWTWTNKGKKFSAVFIPSNVAAKQVVGTVVVKPLPFGGEVKTTATADFEWPYVGEPALQDVPVEV